MNLDDIIKTDISGTTFRSVKERRKEFKRDIPNAILINKTKDSIYYKSRSTKDTKKHYEMVVRKNNTNDIFIFCSCEAFLYQGFAYRAHKIGCGIKKEIREDLKWRKYHGSNSILCKHLWILFHKDKKELKKNLFSLKNSNKIKYNPKNKI